MGETKIEWASHTHNWLAGCTKVSPACTNCYAETWSRNMQRMAQSGQAPDRYNGVIGANGRWTGDIHYSPDDLRKLFDGLRNARKPRRVFCNSMSDTFHEDVPEESLINLAQEILHFEEMADREHGHVIMLLTKRVERMLEWQCKYFPDGLPTWVWVGCTVESQEWAEKRVPVLLNVATQPGGVRFVSCEPLVQPVCLTEISPPDRPWVINALAGQHAFPGFDTPLAWGSGRPNERGARIHWVIAGGESGKGARPAHPDWYRRLRDDCVDSGVAFHFKQWGEWVEAPDAEIGDMVGKGWGRFARMLPDSGTVYHPMSKNDNLTNLERVGKRKAGRELDGRTWDEVPS